MRRIVLATLVLVVAVALFVGLHPISPTRTFDDYQHKAKDTAESVLSSVQTAHLARLVNLSRPGRYTVRVSRVDPTTRTVVKSNEITLNVVP